MVKFAVEVIILKTNANEITEEHLMVTIPVIIVPSR